MEEISLAKMGFSSEGKKMKPRCAAIDKVKRGRCRKQAAEGCQKCLFHMEEENMPQKEEKSDDHKECKCDRAKFMAEAMWVIHMIICKLQSQYGVHEGAELCKAAHDNKDMYLEAYKNLYKSDPEKFEALFTPEDIIQNLHIKDILMMK